MKFLIAIRDAFKRVSAAQRKAMYKFATVVGTALVIKAGVDADTAVGLVSTVGLFITTVIAPILAHINVNDD